MQGLVTWLCYLALFLLMTTHLREPAATERLLTAIVLGSIPVVAYGLAQWLGLDPLDWQTEGSPVTSTLGRSNFVSAYLVIVIPLTLQRAWQAHERIKRAAYSLLIVAQVVCLFAAASRAAWFGLLAAGSVIGLAVIWQRGHQRLARIGLVIGVMVMLAGPLTLMLIPNAPGSIGARATIWRSTLSLVADRPILGHGLETFGQTFTAVSPPELVYEQGRAVYVDRAHNLLLDTAASIGVIGLIVYAVVIGAALAIGLRSFVRAKDLSQRSILLAGLAAGVGHLAETQFSFEVTTTAVLFWMVLGLFVAPWTNQSPALMTLVRKRRVSRLQSVWATLLAAVVVSTSAIVLAADAFAGDANRSSTPAELNHSITAMQRAVALWPGQAAYRLHLSWLYALRAQRAQLIEPTAAAYRAAESELDAARALTPADYRVWTAYGELYAEWAAAGETSHFAQAEAAYRHAAELFPGNAMLHTGWGLVYADQQRWREAADQFQQAVALDNTDAWAYTHLAEALAIQGNLAEAERAYLQALRWTP